MKKPEAFLLPAFFIFLINLVIKNENNEHKLEIGLQPYPSL